MKLMSYKDALTKGQKAVDKMLIPSKVKKYRKKAELEMCELEEKIATKEASLQRMCSSEDVNFSEIIETQDSLDLLNRRKEQYQKILDEMFPENDK